MNYKTCAGHFIIVFSTSVDAVYFKYQTFAAACTSASLTMSDYSLRICLADNSATTTNNSRKSTVSDLSPTK